MTKNKYIYLSIPSVSRSIVSMARFKFIWPVFSSSWTFFKLWISVFFIAYSSRNLRRTYKKNTYIQNWGIIRKFVVFGFHGKFTVQYKRLKNCFPKVCHCKRKITKNGNQGDACVAIMCRNDELSWTMSWVGCLLTN